MYRKSWQGWLKHIDFIILDMLCLEIAFIAAYVFRNGFDNPWQSQLYRNMNVILIFADMFIILFSNSMKNVLKRGAYKELVQTAKHVILVELLCILYLFSFQLGEDYSRTILYLTGIIYLIFSYAMRFVWKKMLERKMSNSGKRSLLIVTTAKFAKSAVDNIVNNNYEMVQPKGVVIIDKVTDKKSIGGLPIVANADNVFDYVQTEWIDEVFLNVPMDYKDIQMWIDKFTEMGIVVHIKLMEYSESNAYSQHIERLGKYTVMTVGINMATMGEAILKRLLDILGGIVGSIIAILLTIVLGPMIYIASPGPIFFKQVRIGKNGRKFNMYKFRSMYMDAEERKAELMKDNRVGDGMMFKLDWDPRIIGNKVLPDGTMKKGLGNIIREFSLDEFPQFFNVLKGDMSLIGTRPPTVDEWEKYSSHHRARMAMKPGITGMWQVSGRSNITDFDKVVELDMKYIKNWTLGLDIKILFKTIAVIFKKEGSM